MRSELIFNGQLFSAFDAYVATSNFLDGAAKDYTSVSVLGRSGDLQISNNRYKNITVKVRVYVRSNMEQNIRAMRSYLESVNGYARLELSDQPNEYRIGLYKEMFVPSSYDVNVGVVDLTFDCKPQRFLKSGENPVSASSQSVSYEGNPVEIDNPSGLSAVSSLAVSLNPIQTGTGNPSTSNVRPISGHNYASVGVTGKNLLIGSDTFADWRLATNTTGNEPVLVQDSRTNYVHFPNVATATIQQAAICNRRIPYFMLRNKTLTFSLDVRVASGATTDLNIQYEVYADAESGIRTVYTNRDFDLSTGTGNWIHLTQTRTFTDDMFTLGSGTVNFETCYVRVSVWKKHTIGATAGFDIRNPQLEFGSTGTAYATPTGLAETMLPLGRTVYGGTLNLTTGVLKVDKGMFVVSGGMSENSSWSNTSTIAVSGNVLSPVADSSKINTAISSTLVNATTLGISTAVGGNSVTSPCFGLNATQSNAGYLYLRLPKATCGSTASAVNTWLSSNPITVVYPLYSPQTYQLTPQQVSLLTGINYISSSDEVTVVVTEPSLLENPTLFESKPLIRVYGSGLLAVNNQYITVATNPFPYIDIDCDMMDAFCGSNNANSYVSLPNDYITLKSGNNYIAYDGTVEITPRWFEI